MDIKSNLALREYNNSTAMTAVKPPQDTAEEAVGRFAASFVETLREGERAAADGLTGKADAHSVVEALAATELAVETAVTVRDKVIEAYQEILRMPV